MNKKNGKLAYAFRRVSGQEDSWEIDKGLYRPHRLFRNLRQHVTEYGSGEYFFHTTLKNWELIDEQYGEIGETNGGI